MLKKTCAVVAGVVLGVCWYAGVCAQSGDSTTAAQVVSDTGPAAVSAAATEAPQTTETQPEPPAPKIVTGIVITGNATISSNTIISKMKTRVGSPYQENVVSDDLKRLYLLEFFDDISITTEDYQGGLKVVVSVVERPLIGAITFSGMRRITMTDEKLKDMLKSKQGQPLDYPRLSGDVEALRKLYEKIGYSQVQINHDVKVDKETNRATVQFNVTEGRRVVIKEIVVEGAKAFPAHRIRKLMKTKRAWFFGAGVLKDEVLREDRERIKAFYEQNGYSDVEAEYSQQTIGRFITITITITEGTKYLVGTVALEGNRELHEKTLLAALSACTTGKVFSRQAMQQDISGIQGTYFDRGYILAQVQETTVVNPATSRVDITYQINENQIVYVDKIKVRGNVKTKDVVIRRELRIKPGERFDGEKLRRSKERLQNLGFFEEISYDTEDTPVSNKKDLIVDVKESKTGAFSFGGGYSTVDQFIGFIEVEQKNFDWKNFPYFTGAGQDLKLRASLGTLSEGYTLSFTEPWLFDYPISFGFDAYRRSHQRDEDGGYGYDEDITGGDLRLGKEISEYLRADATYRYETIEISNITDSASDDLKKELGKNAISSAEWALSFDSRDNVFNPRKGNLLSGSFTNAGGPLGGDKDFLKFFGRASHYLPLPLNAVLEFRGRIGLAQPYGNSDDIPIYERYFAGGSNTIRGYRERSIGPIDPISNDPLGGESMLLGNLEYTYPLASFIRAAAFYDIGNVWAKMGDLGTSGLKSSFGLGLRIKTPIGPLMLDYGIPLDKEPGEEKKSTGRFHFSMSHGF